MPDHTKAEKARKAIRLAFAKTEAARKKRAAARRKKKK